MWKREGEFTYPIFNVIYGYRKAKSWERKRVREEKGPISDAVVQDNGELT